MGVGEGGRGGTRVGEGGAADTIMHTLPMPTNMCALTLCWPLCMHTSAYLVWAFLAADVRFSRHVAVHNKQLRCDHCAGMQLLHSKHASIPLQPIFTSSSSVATDSLPQQHERQQGWLQLQDSSHQPTEPRLSPGPVSNQSSPSCRLVFDIDSDSQEDLPESAPLPQQWQESSAHHGRQQQMPPQPKQQQQQQQQMPEQQFIISQTSEPVIRHGSMNNETFTGCQLEFASDSCPEELAKPAQQQQSQQQQQQSITEQQASRSIEGPAATDASEGCRLVFDVDSDPTDSPEQLLRHVTWQPTGWSHGRSADAPPPGYCRVSMSQHESQLTDRQAVGAADAMEVGFTHHPQVSRSVRLGAQYATPGLQQNSQSAQTPPTAPASMPSPHPRLGPAPITAAGRLQHSSTDAQASSPAQHDTLMQDRQINSHRHLEAAEQLGPGAAAAQEGDGCPLVFEDNGLGVIQEEEEQMESMQGLAGVASPELQPDANTTAAESGHPYTKPGAILQPYPHSHPQSQPNSQCRRQQSLHSVIHNTLRQPESMHIQLERDSCPLVFHPETHQEQHVRAGADHITGCTQTHFATGQSQNSPQPARCSPAQPTQTGTHDGIVRPAQQRSDHMADHMTAHMTAHMASHVFNMHQDPPQHSTDPHSSIIEAGGNSVWCDNFEMSPAETSIHSRQSNYVNGVFGSCGHMDGVQVSFLQLQSYTCWRLHSTRFLNAGDRQTLAH